MTTPGSRSAQQAYQQQAQQNFSNFQRNSTNHRGRRGGRGPIRRLIGFVFALVFLAVVAGIALTILSVAEPHWFDHVKAWFTHIF